MNPGRMKRKLERMRRWGDHGGVLSERTPKNYK